MKIKNINPLGDVAVAALGMKLVRRGEVVEVPKDVAPLLLIQDANWKPVDKAAKDLAAEAIPAHLAELAAASLPPAPGVGDADTQPEASETPSASPAADGADSEGRAQE